MIETVVSRHRDTAIKLSLDEGIIDPTLSEEEKNDEQAKSKPTKSFINLKEQLLVNSLYQKLLQENYPDLRDRDIDRIIHSFFSVNALIEFARGQIKDIQYLKLEINPFSNSKAFEEVLEKHLSEYEKRLKHNIKIANFTRDIKERLEVSFNGLIDQAVEAEVDVLKASEKPKAEIVAKVAEEKANEATKKAQEVATKTIEALGKAKMDQIKKVSFDGKRTKRKVYNFLNAGPCSKFERQIVLQTNYRGVGGPAFRFVPVDGRISKIRNR